MSYEIINFFYANLRLEGMYLRMVFVDFKCDRICTAYTF